MTLVQSELSHALDATLLKADARTSDVERLASDAVRLGCAAVCVAPVHVETAARALRESGVKVASVAGFPLGSSPATSKLDECRFALTQGATELDIVLPIWAVVDGAWGEVEHELRLLLESTSGATRKLILEMALLPGATLLRVANLINRLRPEFVKTGTGYGPPVTTEDVLTLRRLLDPAIEIKAAGGIRTGQHARALLDAGATRLGTSDPASVLAS